ncbi:MAG: hypothetical protein JOZ57_04120, partial [Abitibacteriaceae bacterium]|nr:hypothetical protein [Abditibacteriaceae bacterium]
MEQRRKEGKDLLLLMLPAVALAGLGLVLHSRDMSTTPAKIPTNPAFGLPQWRLSLFQDSTGTVVDTSGVKLIFPDLQTQGKGSGASSLMMSGPGGGGLNMGIGQLRLASTYAQGVNTMTVNNHTCKFEDHGMKLTIDQQTFDLSDAKHTIIVPRSGQGTLQPLALAIGGHSPAVQRHVGAGT